MTGDFSIDGKEQNAELSRSMASGYLVYQKESRFRDSLIRALLLPFCVLSFLPPFFSGGGGRLSSAPQLGSPPQAVVAVLSRMSLWYPAPYLNGQPQSS